MSGWSFYSFIIIELELLWKCLKIDPSGNLLAYKKNIMLVVGDSKDRRT